MSWYIIHAYIGGFAISSKWCWACQSDSQEMMSCWFYVPRKSHDRVLTIFSNLYWHQISIYSVFHFSDCYSKLLIFLCFYICELFYGFACLWPQMSTSTRWNLPFWMNVVGFSYAWFVIFGETQCCIVNREMAAQTLGIQMLHYFKSMPIALDWN